jgi:hypothetical protein
MLAALALFLWLGGCFKLSAGKPAGGKKAH